MPLSWRDLQVILRGLGVEAREATPPASGLTFSWEIEGDARAIVVVLQDEGKRLRLTTTMLYMHPCLPNPLRLLETLAVLNQRLSTVRLAWDKNNDGAVTASATHWLGDQTAISPSLEQVLRAYRAELEMVWPQVQDAVLESAPPQDDDFI